MATDTYRHKGMRKRLVEELRHKGISDERVLAAIGLVPRHSFFDPAFDEWAYQDNAFPISCDQTISQPYTVAYQTQLLQVKKSDRILEIGTGSGYQAAILAVMGARVYTIERFEKLYQAATNLLNSLGYKNIRTFFGDGYKGLPAYAPFEKILVTCGATSIPKALQEQLTTGGKLVIPVGKADTQQMLRITRLSDYEFQTETFADFRFVPFLTGVEKDR